jgi:hypothetical protein
MSVRLNYWHLGDGVEMPLCPLCDQPMRRGEDVNLVESDSECVGLAHRNCCLAEEEDDDD